MTLETTVSKAVYTGNGATTEFPFSFKVWEKDQILVSVTDAQGYVQETGEYSVALSAGGGTVFYLHDGAPLPSGWKLAITRDMPFTQEDDYITGTRFDPEVIETALDKATAERQQLLEQLQRAVILPPTSDETPEDMAQELLKARDDVQDMLAEVGTEIGNHSIVTAEGGTAGRTLASRFADVVNVKDFGAKGDGVTDDTAAIQAAINYAATLAAAGKPVPVVGSGNYGISRQIVLRGNPPQEDQELRLSAVTVLDTWSNAGAIEAPEGYGYYPAVYVYPLRAKVWIGKLDCTHKCAGIFFRLPDSTLLPGCTIRHQKDYGISWKEGNTLILNPLIKQWEQGEPGYNDDASRTAVGILVDGIDSKVFHADVGGCGCCIKFTERSANNIFVGCHPWDGGTAGVKRVDAIIIENHSPYPNYMYDTYFDNGHVDMYTDTLKIEGGLWVNDTSAATVNGPIVRYYYTGVNAPYGAGIRNAKLTVGFYEKNGAFSGDYTTGIDASGITKTGSVTELGRNTVRIITDDRALEPYETLVKPSTSARRCIFLNDKGINETFYDKILRYSSNDGSAGFNIFCGGGSTGIGEDAEYAGTLILFAAQAKQISVSNTGLYPVNDNAFRLGSPIQRFSQLYAGTGTINTSDERAKTSISSPDEALMRAWSKVNFKTFQFTDAVEKKGEDARIHFGVIAQQVAEAFASEGLDASRYALFCYDKWDDEYEDVEVVDVEAVLDEDGNEVKPAVTHTEKRLVTPAGERYGIRYSEALVLECAYQRWRLDKLEAKWCRPCPA